MLQGGGDLETHLFTDYRIMGDLQVLLVVTGLLVYGDLLGPAQLILGLRDAVNF